MCVHRVMQHLSILCTVFGTMPFSTSKNPAERLRLRPLKMIWTSFLTLWTFCNIAVTPLFFKTKKAVVNISNMADGFPVLVPGNLSLAESFYTDEESVSHGLTFLKMVNPWSIFLMSLASHFVTVFRLRTRLPTFLEDLAFIDSRLTQLTKTVPETSNYGPALLGLTAFPVPILSFYLYTVRNDEWLKFSWCVCQAFSNMISYSCELQFLMLCYAVGTRFKTLNQFFPNRSSRDLVHQTWLHPRDPIFGNTRKLTAPVVQLALDCYLKLCRLVGLLNDIYSVQILFSMGGCFVKALLNVYFAFFGVHNKQGDFVMGNRLMDVIRTALWTVYYGMRFISHAVAASITIDQASRTKIVISSLYSRHLDSPVKDSLHIFWKNCSCQKLEITGCGLFTLKSSLILEGEKTFIVTGKKQVTIRQGGDIFWFRVVPNTYYCKPFYTERFVMSVKAFLRPMFTVCILFGTMPLRFASFHPIKLRVSPSSLTYAIVLVTLTFCNMIFTTFHIVYDTKIKYVGTAGRRSDCSPLREPSPYQSIVLQVINAQILIFMSLGSHYVSICPLVTKLPLLIDYIVSMDRKLPRLDIDLRSDRTDFLLALKFCLLLAGTAPAFLLYTYLHAEEKLLWFVTLVFHNLVSYSCELQLLVFFLYIKSRFQILNDVLSLRNRENENHMKSLSSRKILFTSFNERHLLRHISLIHESYLKLCDSWVILNDIYSVQVLFSTSGCFLKALFNIYILLSSNTEVVDRKIVNSLMWMIFYFYRFIFMAAVATSTADEANKTKSIIAYMSCFYFEASVKEELEVFWVNASCRELEFSTCGLFKLNSSLITKACVTGITYLVLLVQFNPQLGLV